MAFYVVYIQEAHPIDAWQDEDNQKDKIEVASERTLDERCAVANTCFTKLSIKIPAVIDDLQNSTERAYTAWPDRLYVIDASGRIAFKSRPGPYGFKPDDVANMLKRIVPLEPVRQAALSNPVNRWSSILVAGSGQSVHQAGPRPNMPFPSHWPPSITSTSPVTKSAKSETS